MKATLIVIQNDTAFTEGKALVEALMGSDDPKDRARMVAQASLVEAHESGPESNAFPNPLRRPYHGQPVRRSCDYRHRCGVGSLRSPQSSYAPTSE